MVIICTKIGITNHDEYSLVRTVHRKYILLQPDTHKHCKIIWVQPSHLVSTWKNICLQSGGPFSWANRRKEKKVFFNYCSVHCTLTEHSTH